MKLLKGIGIGLCLTTVCVLVAPKAKADDSNEKTTIVLNQPVEVPGVGQHLLMPGTYVFKLLNSPVDRHIVEIYNQDETKILTTVLTITNHRAHATNNSVVTFSERPAGEPQAVKAWFFSGQHYGEQFVWDRPKAIILAKETNEVVLSTPVVVDAPVEALKTAPLEAVTPTGETVETAVVVAAPSVEVASAAPAPMLPKTGSDLPLIGLAGLLALAGGFGLLGFSKLKA
jgi:LPXTG-motif cell wall-anchored protein